MIGTYSIPSGNLLQGVISSITTDTVTGEISYTPLNFGPPNFTTLEATVPVSTGTMFAAGDTVSCLVKATAVSLLSYPI
jgi:molybdopterin-binding protein